MATKKRSAVTPFARSGYLVTDAALAALARDYMDGITRADTVRGSYLRVLVAHSKRALRSVKDALEAVEQTHLHLYGVITNAVTTPDIEPAEGLIAEERDRRTRERNRRTNFARTAKSTLVSWIRAGGELKTLNPKEVTKDKLQELYAQARPPDRKSTWERLETRVEDLLKKLVEDDLDEAQALVNSLQAKINAVIAPEAGRKPVASRKKKVGELVLHPH